ncbi:hypothetical protein [Streptomyces sp. NBC_01216]|uniref:hypothetical protein n=1 Tax=unclassified Streptomyces TaxID=2593676 RepID=UPI002E165880|nr:hypothetical protein OG393_10260 [Streptomyces sp. NBC_01216]
MSRARRTTRPARSRHANGGRDAARGRPALARATLGGAASGIARAVTAWLLDRLSS